ncbi:pentatricopeptide repeat-containing protein At4g02750-like [Cryptomeria japonica]|uniref:pentatricopeptide repeat-containing protein At4g02750-like n=1 Tax=Cryptomeria japonica TaxID=3369 RepID=UPI0027DA2C3F|nr:pentatricopeptide repeat-containing protein At4g02750-like [Cryptomeria japonica]
MFYIILDGLKKKKTLIRSGFLFYTVKSLTPQQLHTNTQNICENVRALCKQGQLAEALYVLHNVMDKRAIQPDSYAYSSLLQASLRLKSITQAKIIHAHLILTGIRIDIYLGNQIVTTYAKCGRLADAHRVLTQLPLVDEVSFTVMVSAYTKQGYALEALKVFCEMQRVGIRPDSFTLSAVLSACIKMASLQLGREVHENIIRSGYQSDVFVGSGLVDMYVKIGSIEDARKLFDKMPERDVVFWTSMIAGYAREGDVDKASKLFEKMPEKNVVSWTAIVVACARGGYLEEARELFERMPERNVVSWNAMISGYAQNGRVGIALDLFWKMPERNVVSWNAMIAGYEQNGCFVEAVELFKQMVSRGVKSDPDTFASVIPACAQLASLQQGKEIHEDVIRSGFQFDEFVGSALVDMYAKSGCIKDARKMFDKMPRQNRVSWTAMIVGYAMHGSNEEALHLFEQMQGSGTKPNGVTFVGVLSACCHAGLVDNGWQYFNSMSKDYGIEPRLEHYCCMVDLLGRAGHLEEAKHFIHEMPLKPNASVWVTLLGACRVHNNIKLAEYVAKKLTDLDPMNSTHYVLLSNIYGAVGRWDDMEKVRNLMKDKGVKKVPGCSWIEIKDKLFPFFVGHTSYSQPEEI